MTVQGRKACQEETETEEKSTPEEERRKELLKYPYLTWFLKTEAAGKEEKQEKWDVERLRREMMRPEEYERAEEYEEVVKKRLERDYKSKVEEWLVREGLGSSEVDRILS